MARQEVTTTRRDPATAGRLSPAKLMPLAAIVLLATAIIATGWHRELSLEALVRHRAAVDAFVDHHLLAAVAAFLALYVTVVALSIPGAVFLTVTAGILFGCLVGGLVALAGATIGATLIFLIARSALSEYVQRRAGPRLAKLAEGFKADAFSYLLFLRLVPVFPFWLVNLAPALLGVRLRTFVLATALGVIPATFVFAFVGSGLDSLVAAQESAYHACLASGRSDCRLDFDLMAAATPRLLIALTALGILALVPTLVRRWRSRGLATASSHR